MLHPELPFSSAEPKAEDYYYFPHYDPYKAVMRLRTQLWLVEMRSFRYLNLFGEDWL
jgi:hypothetical protein